MGSRWLKLGLSNCTSIHMSILSTRDSHSLHSLLLDQISPLILLVLHFLLNVLEVVHVWPNTLQSIWLAQPLKPLLRSSQFIGLCCNDGCEFKIVNTLPNFSFLKLA